VWIIGTILKMKHIKQCLIELLEDKLKNCTDEKEKVFLLEEISKLK